MSVEIVASKSVSFYELQRMAGVLKDAVYEKPWELTNWPLGSPEEEPSTSGSVLSYLRFLNNQGADYVTMHCNETNQIVGLGISGVFTADSCSQIDVTRGISANTIQETLNEDMTCPLPGDYYIAVWAIQGSTGENNRELACYRSRKIKNKKGYRWMAEMTINFALESKAKRIWVRTHPGQEKVTHMCSSLGFKQIGTPVYQHCGDQVAPRIVMVAKPEWIKGVTTKKFVFE